MTITEFLLARIAEDEAALERRGAFPHSTHGTDEVGAYNPRCPDCLGLPGKARVLAECKAKRTIIRQAGEVEALAAMGVYSEYSPYGLRYAMCALASIYAEHPDYDPDWAPPPLGRQ